MEDHGDGPRREKTRKRVLTNVNTIFCKSVSKKALISLAERIIKNHKRIKKSDNNLTRTSKIIFITLICKMWYNTFKSFDFTRRDMSEGIMIDIDIMKDASEIIKYDSDMISYAVQERLLSDYTDMRAIAHWHYDIECIYITEGEMNYDINGNKILLNKGDFIFVNSKQVHFGYSNFKRECEFIVILISPELFRCNVGLYQEYVDNILSNKNFEYLYISADDDSYIEYLQSIVSVKNRILVYKKSVENQEKKIYESYKITGLLYELWDVIQRAVNKYMSENGVEDEDDINNYSDVKLQRLMLRYIFDNYSEQLTLEDIAESACIGRSKCCKIFQKYVNQTPVEYLNNYRLEISKKLLKNTNYSITNIALSCGYNYTSYYSKMFLKRYNESPSDYRKRSGSKVS